MTSHPDEPPDSAKGRRSEPSEPVVVTMVFDTDRPAELAPVLARYVVMSRGHDGCRNIDLMASETTDGRFVVVEKWAGPGAQRRHFDSAEMVEMARAASELLVRAPEIDLHRPISAHDLA